MNNDSREAPAIIPVPEKTPDAQEIKEAGVEVEQPQKQVEVPKAPAKEATPTQAMPVVLPTTPTAPAKDAYHKRLERTLEDGLADMYLKMPKAKRKEFKAEGERVASQLRLMINSTKVKVKEVMRLITNWLKMIPGVSQWFLEQEAKIKADKVVQMAEERRKDKEGV